MNAAKPPLCVALPGRITIAARARCVKISCPAGEMVSCARELPVDPSVENQHPALHMMVRGGDDCVTPGVGLEMSADFVGVGVDTLLLGNSARSLAGKFKSGNGGSTPAGY